MRPDLASRIVASRIGGIPARPELGGPKLRGSSASRMSYLLRCRFRGGARECVCAHVVQCVPTGGMCGFVCFSASRMSGVWNRVYSSASRMSGGVEYRVLNGMAARPVRGPKVTGCIDENLGFS